jgi:V/A-type H+-transporting ATPase subunit K
MGIMNIAISPGTAWAIGGAAIAISTAGLSTAIGCWLAGLSAAGSVAEKKENFKNALVLQALPQTQTVYAFITCLLIFMGIGLLGGKGMELDVPHGLAIFFAGAIVAVTSISAVYQGSVAAAGIVSTTKNPETFGPCLVFGGQCETTAIFGFILSLIFLIVGLGVLG